eukprot:Skav204937  [mRNA]  locus=scaffold2700:6939:8218:- [translate_table: standard]
MEELFEMLDLDGGGTLTQDEFLEGTSLRPQPAGTGVGGPGWCPRVCCGWVARLAWNGEVTAAWLGIRQNLTVEQQPFGLLPEPTDPWRESLLSAETKMARGAGNGSETPKMVRPVSLLPCACACCAIAHDDDDVNTDGKD